MWLENDFCVIELYYWVLLYTIINTLNQQNSYTVPFDQHHKSFHIILFDFTLTLFVGAQQHVMKIMLKDVP